MEDLASPVFLVQGFGSSVAVLRPLERRVRRIGRAAFCPCPPLGLGDIRDAAEVLYEAIERTAAASPFGRADVVGHSMGGLVTLGLAARHPGRFRRLGLIG
ncbi:MAG TPA: alpha/beta fold hydrolase, partial [Solirubrobacterales bacterium]|nr:alpha/beta fold hydrolase [Solirubrobacterales bacterium]